MQTVKFFTHIPCFMLSVYDTQYLIYDTYENLYIGFNTCALLLLFFPRRPLLTLFVGVALLEVLSVVEVLPKLEVSSCNFKTMYKLLLFIKVFVIDVMRSKDNLSSRIAFLELFENMHVNVNYKFNQIEENFNQVNKEFRKCKTL